MIQTRIKIIEETGKPTKYIAQRFGVEPIFRWLIICIPFAWLDIPCIFSWNDIEYPLKKEYIGLNDAKVAINEYLCEIEDEKTAKKNKLKKRIKYQKYPLDEKAN